MCNASYRFRILFPYSTCHVIVYEFSSAYSSCSQKVFPLTSSLRCIEYRYVSTIIFYRPTTGVSRVNITLFRNLYIFTHGIDPSVVVDEGHRKQSSKIYSIQILHFYSINYWKWIRLNIIRLYYYTGRVDATVIISTLYHSK